MLSIERIINRNSWRDIIYALSSGGEEMRSLAIWVSKRTPKHYDHQGFVNMWDEARAYRGTKKYTLKSIAYWAQIDSPDIYVSFRRESIYSMIMSDIKRKVIFGKLQHSQVAKYLHFMFKNKFITDNNNNNTTWYEFVTETDNDIIPGQIYKWRAVNNQPDTLIIYIGNGFTTICERILNDIDTKIDKETDPDTLKMFNVLRSRFASAINSIFTNAFKMNSIKEAESYFRMNSFVKKFDKTPNIIGVGNGVLEFNGGEAKLLTHYHSYPISLYTDTDYIQYDENDKYIKDVYSVLKSMFPEDEMDAYEFLLYYLSTSLDGHAKDSIFFILTGIGCHSYGTKIMMYDTTIKKVQDVVIGDKLMGDDGKARNVKQLYRGIDKMVQIKPAHSKPFKVNVNHVLSLQFLTTTTIYSKKSLVSNEIMFVAEWFEYPIKANDAPIYKNKTFESKMDANCYLLEMFNTNMKMVKKGDMIDIKVSEFMKWPSHWMSRSGVVLYRNIPFARSYKKAIYESFSISIVEDEEYYGFELDGNKRYMTADLFIHHNSNGKSFLMEFLNSTLGEHYIKKLPISFVTTQKREDAAGANSALMQLKHARLSYFSESEKNEKLNTAVMKEITGNETLSGRELFKSQENFKPNCNFVVTTNNRFCIDSTDYAIWRRIITYRMKIIFVSKLKHDNEFERLGNKELTEKCKNDKRYQEAFLSILAHYRTKLYEEYDGQLANVPRPTIDEETTDYRNKEDIISRFIDSKCYFSEGASQNVDEIIALFRIYYKLQSNQNHKGTNDDLKAVFVNSKLQKYFRFANGVTRLINYKIVEEAYEPLDGELLMSDYEKTKQNK